jgi:hypothetical protein
MAALPENFLKSVIADAAALKGIKDANGNVRENDPTISACAKIAYNQICEACRQPFHYGERTQVFDEYFGPLLLRSNPIDRTKPIIVLVNGEEVESDEWKISKNRLVLYGVSDTDTGEILFQDIEFFSTCGIKLLEEIPRLYTAVQLQTIGNLNRKDTLGMAETSGEKGIAKKLADEGELLDSVKNLIGDFIYNGPGYSLDGE